MLNCIPCINRDFYRYITKFQDLIKAHPIPCALGSIAFGAVMIGGIKYLRRNPIPNVITSQPIVVVRKDEQTSSLISSMDFHKYLEEGIDISPKMIDELIECIPAVVADRRPHPSITWLSYGNYDVFKLTKYPHIVFKMPRHDGQNPHERFENMVKATEVCFRHKLNRLIIPKAKKIEVTSKGMKYCIIAEQCIELKDNLNELYIQHSEKLTDAVRQLAIFIVNTGFYDVKPCNIPIYNSDGLDWSIVLVDTETCSLDIGHITDGFLGHWNGSPGLLKCVSQAHIPMVLDIARNGGVKFSKEDLMHVFKA